MPISPQCSTLAKRNVFRTSLSRLLHSPNHYKPYRPHFLLNRAIRVQLSTESTDMSQSSSSTARPIWKKYKERSIHRKEANRRALEQEGESADRPPKKQKRQSSDSISRLKGSRIDLDLSRECLQIIQQTLTNAESHRSIRMDDNAPVQDKHSIETERFRRWRDRRLDTLEAEKRSIELQTQVCSFHDNHKRSMT